VIVLSPRSMHARIIMELDKKNNPLASTNTSCLVGIDPPGILRRSRFGTSSRRSMKKEGKFQRNAFNERFEIGRYERKAFQPGRSRTSECSMTTCSTSAKLKRPISWLSFGRCCSLVCLPWRGRCMVSTFLGIEQKDTCLLKKQKPRL
jgi:hypothetical protein